VLDQAAYPVPSAEGLVKLDAMENPYPMPEAWRAALGERLAAVPLHRYPASGQSALRAALARAAGLSEAAPLVLGNGSDELISMLSVLTHRPGTVVLSPAPSFVMYEVSARLAGSRHVGVPLREDFSLDTEAMLAAIARERPALIWLAYPNNPTGNAFDEADLRAIVRAAPGLVVIDEAYQPFAQASWMPELARHPQLLVMRTLSKIGLAGLRLGYLAGARAWVDEIEKVRPPYNINRLSEAAALFALEHLAELDAQAARIRADRQRLVDALSALPGVRTFPSRANFVLVRVPDGPSVARGLLARGVLIKDVGRMHPLLANCLRITVGTPDEITRLVEALASTLASPP